MEKEIINKNKIKEDYFKQTKNNIFSMITFSSFGTLLLTITIFSAIKFYKYLPITYIILFISIASLVMLISFGILIEELKIYIRFKSNNYYITTDTLVSIEEKTGDSRLIFTLKTKPYIFNFAKHGKYSPLQEVYTFSKEFKTTDDGFYNTSSLLDDFYLVMCNKKVILAYNQKFFQLSEDSH